MIIKLSLPRPITDDCNKKKIKHLFDNQAIKKRFIFYKENKLKKLKNFKFLYEDLYSFLGII